MLGVSSKMDYAISREDSILSVPFSLSASVDGSKKRGEGNHCGVVAPVFAGGDEELCSARFCELFERLHERAVVRHSARNSHACVVPAFCEEVGAAFQLLDDRELVAWRRCRACEARISSAKVFGVVARLVSAPKS